MNGMGTTVVILLILIGLILVLAYEGIVTFFSALFGSFLLYLFIAIILGGKYLGKYQRSHPNSRKMRYGTLALLVVVLIGYANYNFLSAPSEKQVIAENGNNVIGQKMNAKPDTLTESTHSKTSTSSPSVQQNGGQYDPILNTIQQRLEREGISGKVIATSYGHNQDGCLVILEDKRRHLAIWNQKNDQVAMVSFADENEEDKYRKEFEKKIIIFSMHIYNDVRDQDQKAGSWDASGKIHTIPVLAEYTEEAGGQAIPGMLFTAGGENPSNYSGVLYEQKNVDMANLVLTEWQALKADGTKRGIDK